MIYIASGYLTRPAKLREKSRFINEMCLSTGFMNEVTSRFVPPLCSRQDNSPKHKKSLKGLAQAKITKINNITRWYLRNDYSVGQKCEIPSIFPSLKKSEQIFTSNQKSVKNFHKFNFFISNGFILSPQ